MVSSLILSPDLMDVRLGVIPDIQSRSDTSLAGLEYCQGQASGAKSAYRATWSLSGRASPSRPLRRFSATTLKTFSSSTEVL